MSRWGRLAGTLAVVLYMVAFATDSKLTPGSTASAASAPPLAQFGYSNGTISDMAPSDMALYLNAIREVTGPGGIVRAPLHWDPYQTSGPSWTKYDAFISALQSRGLVWLPEIHESHNNHYVIPGTSPGGWTDWENGIRAIVDHYGPGGTYAQAHPGFAGMTRFEMWNEPNTPTGNANPTCPSCVMAPATAVTILRTGSAAMRSEAAAKHWTPTVVGGVIGSIDMPYIEAEKKADPSLFSYMNTFSVHVYMHDDPDTCPTTDPRCIRTLGVLRNFMNANGGANVHIGISEGGYSGSNDANRPTYKVVSLAQQASMGKAAIDWIRANPQLMVDFFTPYNPIDKGSKFTGGNLYNYWYDHLGAVYTNLAMKPWGVTYRNLIAAYSTPGGSHTPTVPTGLTNTTAPGAAPSFTWTASTETGGTVTGYLVFRGGTQIAITSATSFTDTTAPIGHTYTYTVEARDADGNVSAASAPIVIGYADTTPPSVPAGLSATSLQGQAPSFSWAPSSDPDDAIAGYIVYRDGTQVGTTITTSFTDSGAPYGGIYGYTVAAKDNNGNMSAQSSPLTISYIDTTPPTTPTGLTGTSPTGGAPSFTWHASTDNAGVADYVVYRNGIQIATVAHPAYTDTSAPINSSQVYTVAAVDAHGNASPQSNPLTIAYRDAQAPTAPTGLAAASPTASAPSLSWHASTDNVAVSGYRVYRDGALIGTPTGTSFVDTAATMPTGAAISDSFHRTASSWGNADVGGRYYYSSLGEGRYWTNGAAALAQVTGGGQSRQGLLPADHLLNANESVTFSLSRMPTGNTARVILVSRAMGTTLTSAEYRLAVEISPSGAMVLTARRYVAGVTTLIGSPVTSTIRFTPGTQYSVRALVTGAPVTQLRLRLWVAGTTEPTTWAFQGSDGAAVLQKPGSTGLRFEAASGMTHWLTAIYRSFHVTNLDPSRTYTYTVRAQDENGNLSPASEPRQVTVN